jgi:hypothetical protein
MPPKQPKPRKEWPAGVRARILLKCRRICALCVVFDGGDLSFKRHGQLAHIDRDPSNSTDENRRIPAPHRADARPPVARFQFIFSPKEAFYHVYHGDF